MRGWRGFLSGALGLIVLEIVVTSNQATGRVTGLFAGVAAAANWLLDTNTPGIPDRTQKHPAASPIVAAKPALLTAPSMATPNPGYAPGGPLVSA